MYLALSCDGESKPCTAKIPHISVVEGEITVGSQATWSAVKKGPCLFRSKSKIGMTRVIHDIDTERSLSYLIYRRAM